MAKLRACSTSRLAMRRVFSCSARERRRLSLRSLTCFSRSVILSCSGLLSFVSSAAASFDSVASSAGSSDFVDSSGLVLNDLIVRMSTE